MPKTLQALVFAIASALPDWTFTAPTECVECRRMGGKGIEHKKPRSRGLFWAEGGISALKC
jgi:hypothetical protein